MTLAHHADRNRLDTSTSKGIVTVTPIEGVDVSYWQGVMNWPAAKTAGKRFGCARAGDPHLAGTVDPQFVANITGMRAAEIAAGSYWLYRTDHDPAAQTRQWLTLNRQAGGVSFLQLDVEKNDAGLSPAAYRAFLAVAAREALASGLPALLYTYPSFWTDVLGNPQTTFGLRLWWADPDGTHPPPAIFGGATIVQYGQASFGWSNGPCDLDRLNGPLSLLQGADMPLTTADIPLIRQAVKAELDTGTGAGQHDWADTSAATLAGVQGNHNLLAALQGQVAAVKAAVLAGLDDTTADRIATAVAAKLPQPQTVAVTPELVRLVAAELVADVDVALTLKAAA